MEWHCMAYGVTLAGHIWNYIYIIPDLRQEIVPDQIRPDKTRYNAFQISYRIYRQNQDLEK